MEEKKYQVFVSSTFTDLISHRKKVIETVLSLYHFPVGMEMFSADDAEQWEIIRETIDVSDYYVIIIGHRYGSLSESGIGYTEKEYDYAKSLGIPVLAFIRDRNVALMNEERETNEELSKKLDDFIVKAKSNKMCDFWSNIDDLATKIAIALPKVMNRTPRPGWIRASNVDSQKISNELARLSAENKELRDVVRRYEESNSQSKPKLHLEFLQEKELFFNFKDYSEEVERPGKINYEELSQEYKELIPKERAERFNESIPSQSEVSKYIEDKVVFFNKEFNSKRMQVKISNRGTKPATNIMVFISVPNFLRVMKKDNAENLTEPTLVIPISPIVEARKILSNPFGDVGKFYIQMQGLSTQNNMMLSLMGDQNESYRYESNEVNFDHRKLLQSLSVEFDEFLLIPIGRGEGEIICTWICEEMPTPKKSIVNIKVE
ncbi:DUF4062 domain-containing protein [Pantoea sp. MBD-2R]|uniref:DUF4062 domain-containing protein n=1 Tax=Pantoea sp. MBD-2R TaxID=3141540 RepID=UPI0031844D13